ncbi:MAG TPA: hypothetical protein VHQ65_05270 [Thermoanaerobaculia bacterium]|nr:hypothetical protein [Thermoanaerobaculia bacterium]
MPDEIETHPASGAAPGTESSRLRDFLEDVHRRTWELELLLSGAVVFALFRLPAKADESYLRLEAQLGGTLEQAAFFGWYYVKLILYTLIGAFLVHLVARAYWVGLVGLDAVFPHGPRLETMEGGPFTRETYLRRLPSLRRHIAVADRFSSAVFSFAFALVFLFLASILYGAVLAAIALAVSRLVFGGEHFGPVFKTLLALVMVPMLLVPLLDKAAGARIAQRGGRPAAVLRRATEVVYFVAAAWLIGPILMTLFTNLKKKWVYPLFLASLVAVLGLFVVRDVLVPRGALAVSSHRFLPADAGELEVDERYYADRREPGRVVHVPMIASEVVTGPWLRLFVPLEADWVDEAVEEHCPSVEPLTDPGLRLRRPNDPPPPAGELAPVLACLATLHEITLNGARLEEVGFYFHTDRETGVRGLLARLPAGELPPGSNVLTIQRKPVPRDERPPRVHAIRFWR